MKYLMLVVRLLDLLTGSGFYEMSRYGANKNNYSLFEIIFPWQRRYARRMQLQEAFRMIILPMMIFSLALSAVPFVGPSVIAFEGGFLVTVIILVVVIPPIGVALL